MRGYQYVLNPIYCTMRKLNGKYDSLIPSKSSPQRECRPERVARWTLTTSRDFCPIKIARPNLSSPLLLNTSIRCVFTGMKL